MVRAHEHWYAFLFGGSVTDRLAPSLPSKVIPYRVTKSIPRPRKCDSRLSLRCPDRGRRPCTSAPSASRSGVLTAPPLPLSPFPLPPSPASPSAPLYTPRPLCFLHRSADGTLLPALDALNDHLRPLVSEPSSHPSSSASQRPPSSSASSSTGSFSSPGGGGALPSGSGTGGHGLLAVFGHPGLARTLVAMFGEVVRTLWLPCHAGASEQILLSVRPGCGWRCGWKCG